MTIHTLESVLTKINVIHTKSWKEACEVTYATDITSVDGRLGTQGLIVPQKYHLPNGLGKRVWWKLQKPIKGLWQLHEYTNKKRSHKTERQLS